MDSLERPRVMDFIQSSRDLTRAVARVRRASTPVSPGLVCWWCVGARGLMGEARKTLCFWHDPPGGQ